MGSEMCIRDSYYASFIVVLVLAAAVLVETLIMVDKIAWEQGALGRLVGAASD